MTALASNYRAALAAHLKNGSRLSARKAVSLGRQAVSLRLETLDLARIHEDAMQEIVSPASSVARRKLLADRAQAFFIEANAPIEQTHVAAAKGVHEGDKLTKELLDRTGQLVISRRRLKHGVVKRKDAENALKERNKHNANLLRKSLAILEDLRSLAREVISKQESERGRTTRQLQDEVSQELLGVNVHLSTIQRTDSRSHGELLKSINRTQRLVERSIKVIRRISQEGKNA